MYNVTIFIKNFRNKNILPLFLNNFLHFYSHDYLIIKFYT